jgi:hypothetical protein
MTMSLFVCHRKSICWSEIYMALSKFLSNPSCQMCIKSHQLSPFKKMSVAILLFGFPIANKYIILHNSISMMVLTIHFPKVAQHD